MKILISFATSVVALTLPCSIAQAKENKSSDFSAFLLSDTLWDTPIASLKKDHPEFKFDWVSGAKDRLRTVGKGMKTFNIDSGEVIVISSPQSEKISAISISYYNKGDNGTITSSNFEQLREKVVDQVNTLTGSRPEDRSGRGTVKMKKTFWRYNDTAFQLESSTNSSTNQPEFLRLRVASLKSSREGTSTARRSSLKSNVVKAKNGDVFINNIPMVDQGQKGYCACASTARIYQYYGLKTDQHEIAQLANSSANGGTSPSEMVRSLKRVTGKLNARLHVLYEYPNGLTSGPTQEEFESGKIRGSAYRDWERAMKDFVDDANDYQRLAKKKGTKSLKGDYDRFDDDQYVHKDAIRRFADPATYREMMMNKPEYDRFVDKVIEHIDEGLPVAWALQLGMFPEKDNPQAFGGHMRLIIGYNKSKKQLIFSDSWGQGHEKKYMDFGNAFSMTDCILIMPPTR
ncbi:hypothetical protein Rhal01_02500 [Rubritalea halochordaticola]|uniref:Peptidase C39-like domain-containing protein n=1 Tax=Rubritalea halochordaticola TaxID=714537 RepID=A0ABP9V0X3_9BACT